MRATTQKPVVCVCGAGSAAHVFSSLLPCWGFEVTMLLSSQSKAVQFKNALGKHGGVVVTNRSNPQNTFESRGKPSRVSGHAADVVPQASIVIISLPSFALQPVLSKIKPHLKDGCVVFVMPGVGGCEHVAQRVLGNRLDNGSVTLAGIVPMPFNCRVANWGQEVDLASVKVAYDIAAIPARNVKMAADHFWSLLDRPVRIVSSFIGLALNGGNANNHPPRMMAAWGEHVEGQMYTENPLFYETWDDASAMWCKRISEERVSIWNAIVEKYPQIGERNFLYDVRTYMAVAYKGQIADDSNIKNVFTQNQGLRGFRFPMMPKGRMWEIDFGHRYFQEDIPEGLCVYKGYAMLVGVPTPAIDAILEHFQKFMGKEYLIDGRVGRDWKDTKAPQAFGYSSLEELVASIGVGKDWTEVEAPQEFVNLSFKDELVASTATAYEHLSRL